MTIFIAIIAALTLLAVLALVRPLLRPRSYESVSSQRLNATIYKDQLAALDRDLASGAISPADHETTRDELQLRLLDDTAEPDAPAGQPWHRASGARGARRPCWPWCCHCSPWARTAGWATRQH